MRKIFLLVPISLLWISCGRSGSLGSQTLLQYGNSNYDDPEMLFYKLLIQAEKQNIGDGLRAKNDTQQWKRRSFADEN